MKANFKLSFLVVIFILLSIFIPTSSYFAQINSFDTTSSQTISSYNTDFASCSCNLHPTICDNYCCCDNSCSSVLINFINRLKYHHGPVVPYAETLLLQLKFFAIHYPQEITQVLTVWPAYTIQTAAVLPIITIFHKSVV